MRLMVVIPICYLLISAAAGFESQVDVYSNIRPGTANKAEVDLNLGEPLQKTGDQEYEYAPPRAVNDTKRVVVSYFADTRQVSRIDVYLKAPLDAELLRPQFGTRVLVRERGNGEREEIFYPRLRALIFNGASAGAPVLAISYLSPRLVADGYVERFNDFLRDKRYEEALTEADKAVLVDSDYARGYVAQGTYWVDQKNYDEAIVRFLAAASTKYPPRYKAVAHARLGMLYWREKHWMDKAPAEFQKAVSLAPDLDEGHLRYGEFLEAQKQNQQAFDEYSKAASLNPNNSRARLAVAAIHFGKGEYAQALPHYESLSQWAETAPGARDEFRAEVYYRYAVCLSETHKGPQAIEAYQKALQRNAALVDAYNRLGLEHKAAGSFDQALESYRSGLKIDAKNFPLNHNLADALLEGGQAEEARRQAELTLRLKPEDAAQKFQMARCWGALGKKKQTLYWVEQAVAAGYKDRARLTQDRFLALVQKDGDFKKLLHEIT